MLEPVWCQYFPRRYYMNLNHRKDRREHFENEMRKHGFTVERFLGVTPTDGGKYGSIGDRGCTESHQAVVRLAKQNNWSNVMIFEDDVYFANDFNDQMNKAVEELKNQKWDLFYCYRELWGKVYFKLNTIQKIQGTYNAHAYVVNNNIYDKILANDRKLIDHFLMEMKDVDKFATITRLSSQMDGYSDRSKSPYQGTKL